MFFNLQLTVDDLELAEDRRQVLVNIESFDRAQDGYRTPTDTFGTSKEYRIMK